MHPPYFCADNRNMAVTAASLLIWTLLYELEKEPWVWYIITIVKIVINQDGE